MENDLYEANLGGDVYKKRVAHNNKGKRGGARTLVTFKKGNNTFFMYGFANSKQDLDNAGELIEVNDDE